MDPPLVTVLSKYKIVQEAFKNQPKCIKCQVTCIRTVFSNSMFSSEHFRVIIIVDCTCNFVSTIVSDPMGEVRKLYDFLGMSLTPEVESAMNSCIKNEFNAVSYKKPVFKNNALFSGESVEKDFKEYLDLMSKRADRSYLI